MRHSGILLLNYLHGWPTHALAASGTVYSMATVMTFAAIVLAQVGAVSGCRTDRISVCKVGLFSNKMILLGIAVECTLLALLIYLPVPPLHALFNTAPLGLREWAFLIWIPPLMLAADEMRKRLLRGMEQRKENNNHRERTVM